MALGSAALVRAGLGQDETAVDLLNEIESYPAARDNQNYSCLLPAMVRIALATRERELAGRLASGLEPRFRYAEHALIAGKAALNEADGDLRAAAEAYGDSADRWEAFGVVAEHAFALLGRGRCLIGLARSTEAASVLQDARAIFEQLGAAPALAQTQSLLQQAAAPSSEGRSVSNG